MQLAYLVLVFWLMVSGLPGRLIEVSSATQPANDDVSTASSRPATEVIDPAATKVLLSVDGRSQPAFYWLRKPVEYASGQRPPLLICLHGTDDSAKQMVDFWAARQVRVPMIIVAPQGVGPGWCDQDVPAIRAMLAHLETNFTYDHQRVLLAGFSAGGAMVFHLLYVEKIPVTAVAALANYVPPRITAEQIKDRRDVPIFYAVGLADINHDRMRRGLTMLRSAGSLVNLYRPRIGHVLDEHVAQSAFDWFFDQCARRLEAMIEASAEDENIPLSVERLEQVLEQSRWHEPMHVQQAMQTLERIEAPGRRQLAEADGLANVGLGADAVEALRAIETRYGLGRLGREARTRREKIEADPVVQKELAERLAKRRADEALAMYAGAQRLVAQRKLPEAIKRCRHIIEIYGDTPSAEKARYLLTLLQTRTPP